MRHADEVLTSFGVPHECRVVSAHRTPGFMAEYAQSAEANGIQIIIAAAGGAAHLPGMVAAHTTLPVLGVPIESRTLHGVDSLLSIVQMPRGVPVGTLAIGQVRCGQRRVAGDRHPGHARPRASRSPEGLPRRAGAPGPSGLALVTGSDLIAPGATIGMLGSGQLGRMLAIAAREMGYRIKTFSPDADSPTGQVADLEVVAAYEDLHAVRAFAQQVDVVTFEFENVPSATADAAAEHAPVRPERAHPARDAAARAREELSRRAWIPGHTIRAGSHERRPRHRTRPDRYRRGAQDSQLRLRRQGAVPRSIARGGRGGLGRDVATGSDPRAVHPVRARGVDDRRARRRWMVGAVRPRRKRTSQPHPRHVGLPGARRSRHRTRALAKSFASCARRSRWSVSCASSSF